MLVSVTVLGLALLLVAARVADFVSRARMVVYFTLAASIYITLADPIWGHQDWIYSVYHFVADFIILAAGGIVIARWFLPRPASVRSAERRVGKEWVRTCRSRWSPDNDKKKTQPQNRDRKY